MEDYNVKIDSVAMGKFYARQLADLKIPVIWEDSLSFEENELILNRIINLYSFKNCAKIIDKIERKYKSTLYITNEIRTNERFCNFSWFYIKKKLLGKLPLNSNGQNIKKRSSEVISNIRKVNGSKYSHLELEMSIVEKWHLSSKNTEIISWLKDEEDKIKWAWNYILKRDPFIVEYIWDTKKLTPDLKDYVITFFDIIDDNKREIAITRIKKAWNQKKFRDQVQSKKQCCINLSESSNKKLNAISNSKKMKRNKIIELLISNEFLKL
ncbi:hypothetical protein ACXZ7F_01435 [Vibrio harveyi]